MNLQLNRPLIFLDLETTGLSISSDRIVELSCLKLFPDGTEQVKTYLLNPTIPISPRATEIHGISDADVAGCPTFADIAHELVEQFEGCDFAGYNSNKFDFPMLAEEFLRAGVDIDLKSRNFIDVQVIFHRMEQRTLSAAYQFYCNKDLTNAHSAEADTRATCEVLMAQLSRYPNLGTDVDALAKFSSVGRSVDYVGRIVYDERDREVFNFGKYRGVPVVEIFEKDPSYYSWMMNGDFPLHTKKVLTALKQRYLAEK